MISLLLLLSWLNLVFSHDCQHDFHVTKMHGPRDSRTGKFGSMKRVSLNYTHRNDVEGRTRSLQSSTPQNIRIVADTHWLNSGSDPYACQYSGQVVQLTDGSGTFTCTSAHVLSASTYAYILNTMIPDAVNFWTSSLSVIPVDGNLTVDQPANCGTTHYLCCGQLLPSYYTTIGVANADFVMMVTARPTTGTTLAWALTCQLDQNNRPILGQINVNPAYVSTLASQRIYQRGVVTHEMAHALGFSSSLMPYFLQADKSTQIASISDILLSYNDPILLKPVIKLITPAVVSFITAHFGCPQLNGAELEDGGSSGSASSHWEKRIFFNELLNPSVENVLYRSKLTLSYFDDSNWYYVNYSTADTYLFGKSGGCTFAQQRCNVSWYDTQFCTSSSTGCSIDDPYRYLGACTLATATNNLPVQFQYFSNPKLGGTDIFADYCPYSIPYTATSSYSYDCRDSSFAIPNYQSVYGQVTGPTSMCFSGTYQSSSYGQTPADHGACLKYSCSSNGILSIIFQLSGSSSSSVTCPVAGGRVALSAPMTGFVRCPPAFQVCSSVNLCSSNTCNGRGSCNATTGACACNAGFYGSAYNKCDLVYCPNAPAQTPCSGNGNCDSSVGVCTCNAGYSGSDCSQRVCPNNCSNRGTCNTTTALCTCNAGFAGADCSGIQCPLNADGSTCVPPYGVCETSSGFCNCSDTANAYYTGPSCNVSMAGTRSIALIPYLDDLYGIVPIGNTSVSVVGTLMPYVYSFYSVQVTSSQSIDVVVRLASTSNLTGLFSITAALGSRPSATVYTYSTLAIKNYANSYRIALTPSMSGTLYIAIISKITVGFNISVTRSGCALIPSCNYGDCMFGQCSCDVGVSNGGSSFGWTGAACNVPLCPTNCTNFRGVCAIPVNADRGGPYPYCSCPSIFYGNYCEQYAKNATTVLLGSSSYSPSPALVSTSVSSFSSDRSSVISMLSNGYGTKVINLTTSSSLVGSSWLLPVVIDPSALMNVNMSSSTFYIMASLKVNSQATSLPNIIMLGGVNNAISPSTITYNTAVDFASYGSRLQSQYFVSSISNSLSFFISVYNLGTQGSLYSPSFTLTVAVSTNKTGCPYLYSCMYGSCIPASGGNLLSNVCSCNTGWIGAFCDTPLNSASLNAVTSVANVVAGTWSYYSITSLPLTPSVIVVSFSANISSWSVSPFLSASLFDGSNGYQYIRDTFIGGTISSASPALGTTKSGFITNSVTLVRSDVVNQNSVIVSIFNPENAPTALNGLLNVSVVSSSFGQFCNNRGTYNGTDPTTNLPICSCLPYWDAKTACSSLTITPAELLASASNILSPSFGSSFTMSLSSTQSIMIKVPYSSSNVLVSIKLTQSKGKLPTPLTPSLAPQLFASYPSIDPPRTSSQLAVASANANAAVSSSLQSSVSVTPTDTNSTIYVVIKNPIDGSYTITIGPNFLSFVPTTTFPQALAQWMISVPAGIASMVISIIINFIALVVTLYFSFKRGPMYTGPDEFSSTVKRAQPSAVQISIDPAFMIGASAGTIDSPKEPSTPDLLGDKRSRKSKVRSVVPSRLSLLATQVKKSIRSVNGSLRGALSPSVAPAPVSGYTGNSNAASGMVYSIPGFAAATTTVAAKPPADDSSVFAGSNPMHNPRASNAYSIPMSSSSSPSPFASVSPLRRPNLLPPS
jgi:Leishmanolysin/EGF-like domain